MTTPCPEEDAAPEPGRPVETVTACDTAGGPPTFRKPSYPSLPLTPAFNVGSSAFSAAPPARTTPTAPLPSPSSRPSSPSPSCPPTTPHGTPISGALKIPWHAAPSFSPCPPTPLMSFTPSINPPTSPENPAVLAFFRGLAVIQSYPLRVQSTLNQRSINFNRVQSTLNQLQSSLINPIFSPRLAYPSPVL